MIVPGPPAFGALDSCSDSTVVQQGQWDHKQQNCWLSQHQNYCHPNKAGEIGQEDVEDEWKRVVHSRCVTGKPVNDPACGRRIEEGHWQL